MLTRKELPLAHDRTRQETAFSHEVKDRQQAGDADTQSHAKNQKQQCGDEVSTVHAGDTSRHIGDQSADW